MAKSGKKTGGTPAKPAGVPQKAPVAASGETSPPRDRKRAAPPPELQPEPAAESPPAPAPQIPAPQIAAPPLTAKPEIPTTPTEAPTPRAPRERDLTLAHGIEAIGHEWMQFARSSFETAGRTAKALLEAKTLEDVIEVQSGFARASFETLFQRTMRLSALGTAVMGELMRPLAARSKLAP